MSNDEELGTLCIVILKAKNLNQRSFYKQDVYAQVTFNGVTKSTKVDVKGGQHPIWDEEVRFPVMKESSTKSRNLQVSCWSKEHRTDDMIGQGKVDIEETLRTGEFDDWVPLEINGVSRGDLYLEMTYYSKAPAPATKLAAPKIAELNRRPSKLKPSERLWRPPQKAQSPPRHDQGHASNRLAASPPSSNSSSPKGRQSPLPPLPEQVPNFLKPAAGMKPKPAVQQTQPLTPDALPSILKPGHGTVKPNVNHIRHGSSSPTRDAQAYGFNPTPDPGSFTNQYPNHNAGIHQHSATPIPQAPLEPWTADTGDLSFPMPQVAPVAPGPSDYGSVNPYGPDHPRYQSQGSYPQVQSNGLPDPYLQARYQSPLPLPPGSEKPDRGRQVSARQEEEARQRRDESRRRREAAEDETRRQREEEARQREFRAAEDDARRRKEEEAELARLRERRAAEEEAQRRKDRAAEARARERRAAEEDAKRRREQEEKDLELARQLDRELNLGGSPATPVVPGGW
ncbi:hypothetical protein C8J56DRAFT_1024055 [Mycena floridula]|nr:hypothetical protein C8J56DRAFT_1024055 [Mycena floridula]